MWRRTIIVLILAIMTDAMAWAEAPSCTPEGTGTVACIAGRLCSCGFARGSPATGLPDGFRWDCGILRPSCGPPVPATLDPWQGELPDSLEIDRSNTIIRQGSAGPRTPPHR